jgi:hypothetical protein
MNGSTSQGDVAMSEVSGQRLETITEDQNEPREKGSEGVETRIEKIIADLRNSGIVDVHDEQEIDTKRVSAPSVVDFCRHMVLDTEDYSLFRLRFHSTCTFHIFEQHLTHAFTARSLPTMLKSCNENV